MYIFLKSNYYVFPWVFFLFHFCALQVLGASEKFEPNIYFKNITAKNGLPVGQTNEVIEDEDGFIWIATNNGLYRYDGPNKFKIYTTYEENLATALKSNEIISLAIASEQNLWVGTRFGGLSRFNMKAQSWKNYSHDLANPNSLSNNDVLCQYIDTKGNHWIGTEKGLNLYNPSSDDFIHFQFGTGKKHPPILSILEDSKGWLWFGTWDGGLYLLTTNNNANTYKNAKFKQFLLPKGNGTRNIWCMHQDNQNRFWIGTFPAGLHYMHLPQEASNLSDQQNWKPAFHRFTFKNEAEQNTYIRDICNDDQGNLWVAKYRIEGLSIISALDLPKMDSVGNLVEINTQPKFRHFSEGQSQLISDDIHDLFVDRNQSIWLSTTNGISVFTKPKIFFTYNKILNKNNKGDKRFRGLAVDANQKLWYCADNKLYCYDINLNIQTLIDQNKWALISNDITHIKNYDKDNILLTSKNGLTKLNKLTLEADTFYFPFKKKYFCSDTYINKDKKSIWVASQKGLLILDENSRSWTTYKNNPNNANSISDNSLTQIYKDDFDNLWISSFAGLNKVINENEDSIKFQQFNYEVDSINQLNTIPFRKALSLYNINDNLYIGSTNGLGSFNYETEKFTNHSKYKNNFNIQYLQGSGDILYVCTAGNLVSFDTSNKKFTEFSIEEGLQERIHSISMSENGVLRFFTTDGFYTVSETKQLKNNELKIFITGFQTDPSKPYLDVHHNKIDNIVLDAEQANVAIHFSSVNYEDFRHNEYTYSLEGYNKNWDTLDARTSVHYSNLPAGEYDFKVKSYNKTQGWSKQTASIQIIKKARFIETLLFKALVSLAIFAVVASFLYMYVSSIQRRNKILQKYNRDLNSEIERRMAIEVELRKSNTDLENFAFISAHDLQEPLKNIGRFSGLLTYQYKSKLDNQAQQYINFIETGAKTVSKMLVDVLEYLSIRDFRPKFELNNLNEIVDFCIYNATKVTKKTPKIIYPKLPNIVCDKQSIQIIFTKLLSNSIKFNHSESPQIEISFSEKEEHWIFSIKDDGIGIDPIYGKDIFEFFKRLNSRDAYEGSGIGLPICKKLVMLHKGEIWLEANEEKGCSFYFSISKFLVDGEK